MASLLDDQFGIAKESVYGTAVTVSRFYPMSKGIKTSWDPRVRQGDGLRGGSGRHSPLAARNYPTIGQGSVTVKVELESKQAGVILEAALGNAVVTTVTGGSQQNFTPTTGATYSPSYTIQIVKVLNSGSTRVETYRGCTASKASIDQGSDGIATVEAVFDAAGVTTATAAATPTYATNPVIFDSFQAQCSVGTSGFTAPTETALASGLTASTEFTEWSIDIDHSIEDGDWKLSSRGRPTLGMPKIKFKGKADFDSSTLPDLFTAGSQISWYCTHTTTEALGAGYTQLQVAIPRMVLSDGVPDIEPGKLRSTDIGGDIIWDGSSSDIYVVYRTTDTAI